MRKIKKMKFKKEIVANLSSTESNQIRGGVISSATHGYCCSHDGCPSDITSCFCGGGSGGEYC